MNSQIRFLPAGDTCLIVEFGKDISLQLHHRVRSLMLALQAQPVPGIVEMVPAYSTLAVHYDPLLAGYGQIYAQVKHLTAAMESYVLPAARRIDIPAVYGSEYGPDLESVAEELGMSAADVVALHAAGDYLVYMLGFTPGFPYLGGMDERLAVPRLEKPRANISAGSIGIAGRQTGIYPVESPGGWRLIGRTPLVLFNAAAAEPVLLKPGDYLRFRPVSREKYIQIQQQAAEGTYRLTVTPRT